MSLAHEKAIGRYEFKYAVPVSMRDRIIELSCDHVCPDKNAKQLGGPLEGTNALGYQVHSLYFDDARLSDYFERLQEHKIRNRLRIRTYGNPGDGAAVFLENKRKLDYLVVKHRVRICNAEEFHATEHPLPWAPWIEQLIGKQRYAGLHFNSLVNHRRAPVTVVHYYREVFVSREKSDSRIRLTMDHDVSASRSIGMSHLYPDPEYNLIPPDWMVLELKFAGTRPAWMRVLCNLLQLSAEPISKFGLSVALGYRSEHLNEIRYLAPHSLRTRLFASTSSTPTSPPEQNL